MNMFKSVFLCFTLAICVHLRVSAGEQSVVLANGWNLFSLQVGEAPFPVADFRDALEGGEVVAIWGYEPGASSALPGTWSFFKAPALPMGNEVTHLVPGKGYWIQVANGVSTGVLSGTPWSGSQTLKAGWNLVGFPGLQLEENEVHDLEALFGDEVDRVQQVWSFDVLSQSFVGFDRSAIPQVEDLKGVLPGQAYWVFLLEEVTLAPLVYASLPPDADADPLQPAVPYTGSDPIYLARDEVRLAAADGSDDVYDLNGNGILDDARTQDTILFEETAGTATISIGNEGGGSAPWSLVNEVDWLFTAPPDERSYPGNVGRPKTASGTVSNERDLIILYVDRQGLSPGRSAPQTIQLQLGDQLRSITVLVDSADISGDWEGSATTRTVNGKEISLGAVRMSLNAFLEQGDTELGGFRVVVDSEKSLLFPRDVFLEGRFYNDQEFQFSTNYVMPPGDRNAPPFETFPGDAQDRDQDGDGEVDLLNPYPFEIRREVTLIGRRVSPDRLEGTFIESIRGMLPPLQENALLNDDAAFRNEAFLQSSQSIIVEGDFVLQRDSFDPSKRSVVNLTELNTIPLGGSDVQSRRLSLDVGSSFSFQGGTLSLDLNFPDPDRLQISLISPSGEVWILHAFGDQSLPGSTISFPSNPNPFANTTDGAGTWELLLEWDTTERGTLRSWGLNLEGVSTYAVNGVVQASGSNLENVQVRLEGSVNPQQLTTGADGAFLFEGLTENDYTLRFIKAGFEEKVEPFFLLDEDLGLGVIELSPISVAVSEIRAAPNMGFQPMVTRLTALVASADLALVDQIEWSIDTNPVTTVSGSIDEFFQIEQSFPEAGIFTVTAMLKQGESQVGDNLTTTIHVHRMKALASPPDEIHERFQVIAGVHFNGHLAARMDAVGLQDTAEVIPLQSVTTVTLDTVSVSSATVFGESKVDVGTFDIDRPPVDTASAGSFNNDAEDTDFFVSTDPASAPGSVYLRISPQSGQAVTRGWQAGDPVFDVQTGDYEVYELPEGGKATRFRMKPRLGAYVFQPEPNRFGGIQLQVGRDR